VRALMIRVSSCFIAARLSASPSPHMTPGRAGSRLDGDMGVAVESVSNGVRAARAARSAVHACHKFFKVSALVYLLYETHYIEDFRE
jgi:hypothetical protein